MTAMLSTSQPVSYIFEPLNYRRRQIEEQNRVEAEARAARAAAIGNSSLSQGEMDPEFDHYIVPDGGDYESLMPFDSINSNTSWDTSESW